MLGMTNYTWFIVIGYAMWPVLIVAAGAVSARCTRESAFEDGRIDALEEIAAERRAAELAARRADEFAGRRAGRHERGAAPRREPAPAQEVDDQFRPPWYREIPGPARPQPARDSGDGTATMPRIQLAAATTTGEFRAASEEDIARRSADNAAWLEEWSAEATA